MPFSQPANFVATTRKASAQYLRDKLGYGMENLPKEGGYVMFPNHQGKYDALGIVYTHKKPCTIPVVYLIGDLFRCHSPILFI